MLLGRSTLSITTLTGWEMRYCCVPYVRMLFSLIALSALAFSLCDAATVPNTHTLHEKRDATSSGWVKRNRVHPLTIMPVRIGLAQSNLERGYGYILDVWVLTPLC